MESFLLLATTELSTKLPIISEKFWNLFLIEFNIEMPYYYMVMELEAEGIQLIRTILGFNLIHTQSCVLFRLFVSIVPLSIEYARVDVFEINLQFDNDICF